MSYDLYVVDPTVSEDDLYDVCDRYEGETHWGDRPKGLYFNYTYNLCKFFSDYGVRPTTDLDGLTAEACAGRITLALRRIEAENPFLLDRLYNPDNGWGSVRGATAWLRRVRDYCLSHPGFVVRERS